MQIVLKPIATVRNKRTGPIDDFWGDTISEITLADDIPTEALDNIEAFSHLEIIYYFDQVDQSKIVYAGHPRGNPDYPKMGILCQRKKDRPNRLGLCTVELVEHTGRTIKVKYLDAIDGTPVLDIKPVMKEFTLNGEIKQPAWVADLMRDYWKC
ncbi:tRNA (N6-threonylcarbamoyladenosine(37)-N6)-methyltransferase TrmO [Mucilaginibacter sp. PPCGB 2223]|uniref:tRNA (N6-threonylcarbamoyladenosine(37)-N6)-methyltransferase TrmO n=1 Tax=Mucilaginibacter sp. PPCGB 2223 TaxID=1886027 RepID=UPI000824B836|nr:tRNA (N6-threonylcarbamoyladenosine(37)-N6)-methyltransferase TrmO [Mucilaginibacter sp. PPCGB 2223]OCX51852.1 tRNA (N6-threonylcarbamoyladenosine(37)-N6)-methyltransferase TrmO [Mucilaginibacter sp. PPCGB 2223]